MNGKPMSVGGLYTFGGQLSQFVKDYFDAPVSLKDIVADMGARFAYPNSSAA
eukprot:COSAG02_NODE_62201_length_266_cov_0.928144_2_plen_51_part_01